MTRATVSRSRGRPRSTAADQAIVAATLAEVRKVGYDAMAMDAVASRAGVGKATLYRRWKSKEALVVDAIGSVMRAVPVPDTGAIETDFQRLLRSAATMYADPATGLLLSGLVAAMQRSVPIGAAVRSGFVATWRDAVRVIVRRAIARGELPRQANVELANDLLSGALLHRFLIVGRPIDNRTTRAVARAVARGLA